MDLRKLVEEEIRTQLGLIEEQKRGVVRIELDNNDQVAVSYILDMIQDRAVQGTLREIIFAETPVFHALIKRMPELRKDIERGADIDSLEIKTKIIKLLSER